MSIQKISLSNGDTKWLARVYVDGRSGNRVSRRFDRKIDAEEFVKNYQRELDDRRKNPFKQIEFADQTFEEEAARWLEAGEIRFSPGNLRRCRTVIKEMLPKYGSLQLSRFTPEVISRFQLEQKKKGITDATVNRKVQIVIAILNHAVKQRRIPFNPAQGYSKLRENYKESLFWNHEEASDFLTMMNEKYPRGSEKRWIYVAYLVALNTGLRAGEIWGLKASDLPLAKPCLLTVRRQFNLVTQEMTPTKNRKSRLVPCSEDVRRELFEVLESNANKSPDATVFQNQKGEPVDHNNFSDRIFEKDLKLWGGKRIRFHDLRHTATTLMIANGVDIKTVKEVCGHADIATTMNYVHLVGSQLEKVPQLFSLKPKA